VIRFTARRSNGEYQTLHLTQAEADNVAATIVSGMSKEGRARLVPGLVGELSKERREKLVPGLLGDLTDAKLLRALAVDLRKRKPRASR
jgi:hypothetical protein